MLKNGQNKIIKMKRWILDNLPAIWIIAIFAFGLVLSANQATYKKEIQQINEKIQNIDSKSDKNTLEQLSFDEKRNSNEYSNI